MTILLIDRLAQFEAAQGDDKRGDRAFLQTWLAPLPAWTWTQGDMRVEVPERPSLFDELLRASSPATADFVAQEIRRPIDAIDSTEMALRINRAIPCD